MFDCFGIISQTNNNVNAFVEAALYTLRRCLLLAQKKGPPKRAF